MAVCTCWCGQADRVTEQLKLHRVHTGTVPHTWRLAVACCLGLVAIQQHRGVEWEEGHVSGQGEHCNVVRDGRAVVGVGRVHRDLADAGDSGGVGMGVGRGVLRQ